MGLDGMGTKGLKHFANCAILDKTSLLKQIAGAF